MATVYVGLSGGVDSALSAALLKEQGHKVVGCFIKIWQPEFIECTWREDRLDAMRVCTALQIPYREIDLSEEYKREVIKDMVDNYTNGITPNPDVLCNRKIKFGSFATWAFSEGADFVATGHYARIHNNDGTFTLLRGVDTSKDQSYFLWQLTHNDLSRTLFPVGGMTKDRVRSEAVQRSLPVAKKKDSQGLCFVGDISLFEFLAHYIPLRSGSVLDADGHIVGTHQGAGLYTPGQRHGFSHSGRRPLFVKSIDIPLNTITVSENKDAAAVSTVYVRNENWIHKPTFPLTCNGQLRYRERAIKCTTEFVEGQYVVSLEQPHLVAQGQSLVWYDEDRLLGGAIVGHSV